MTPTPRAKVKLRPDRSGLFTHVTIEHQGRITRSTVAPGTVRRSLTIENLIRGAAHLPLLRELPDER